MPPRGQDLRHAAELHHGVVRLDGGDLEGVAWHPQTQVRPRRRGRRCLDDSDGGNL